MTHQPHDENLPHREPVEPIRNAEEPIDAEAEAVPRGSTDPFGPPRRNVAPGSKPKPNSKSKSKPKPDPEPAHEEVEAIGGWDDDEAGFMTGRDLVTRRVVLRIRSFALPSFLLQLEHSNRLIFLTRDDPVEIAIEPADHDQFIRSLLGFREVVEIIAPFDLRRMMHLSASRLDRPRARRRTLTPTIRPPQTPQAPQHPKST